MDDGEKAECFIVFFRSVSSLKRNEALASHGTTGRKWEMISGQARSLS